MGSSWLGLWIRRCGVLACVALLMAAALAPGTPAQRAAPNGDGSAVAIFPGVLLPRNTALVKARQDEQVAEVFVRIGARVRKDELILRFVDAQERARRENPA